MQAEAGLSEVVSDLTATLLEIKKERLLEEITTTDAPCQPEPGKLTNPQQSLGMPDRGDASAARSPIASAATGNGTVLIGDMH